MNSSDNEDYCGKFSTLNLQHRPGSSFSENPKLQGI